MGTASEFSILFRKYTEGSATAAESMAFLRMADQEARQEELTQLVDALIAAGSAEEKLDAKEQKEILANIYKAAGTNAGSRILLLRYVLTVAAAVAAITLGMWLYNISNTPRHPELVSGPPLANDIAPGKNTATIKIGNGEAITLSDKQTGVIVGANNLTYNDGSKIAGRHPELVSGPPHSLMTVTTPRGGTYQITLPDGTKVWLNAASVLTYIMPLNERGGVRQVELSGEAYFEVFRNKNQPFVVTTRDLTTTVLGTHFNISAYEDENTARATLLEGSVRVANTPRHPELGSGPPPGKTAMRDVTLKPNQQAFLTGNHELSVKEVNPQLAIAWQKGRFAYNNTHMDEVMREVARWYDVSVAYESEALKGTLLSGSVNRYEKLSGILNALAYTSGLNYKLEGRTVLILKGKKK